MFAIPHPLFETLYVDPDEGLLWDGELPYNNRTTKVAVCIPHAQLVTKQAVEFAASCIADIAGLDSLARNALCSNMNLQASGPCQRYWQRFLLPLTPPHTHASPASSHNPPGATQTQQFMQLLQLSFIGLYPVQTDTPIMLEYTACYRQFPAALQVIMNALPHVIEIRLEKDDL